MWPFPPRSAVTVERQASFDEVRAAQRDLEQRFKTLERELDDLHSFYRRLRAQYAQDARAKGNGEVPAHARQPSPDAPDANLSAKEALRARVLTRKIAQ